MGNTQRTSTKETVQPQDWREGRRLQAWKLKQAGWKQKDIAEALGVTPGAVSQWMKQASEGGAEALRSRSGGGPKPRLSKEQLSKLPDLLGKGAENFGFRGDVWTQARVARLIKDEYRIEYSPRHVGRILANIGWSRQKPVTKASQRDEEKIENWRTNKWVEIEKKPLMRGEP